MAKKLVGETTIFDMDDSRFKISIAVAKRARQIKEGARPLIPVDDSRPLDYINIAQTEIVKGLVSFETLEIKDEEEVLLDEMDSFLDQELKEDGAEEASDEKKGKESSKRSSKSKSLAA